LRSFKPVVVTVDKNVDFPTEGKPISATKLKKNFWKVYRPGLMFKILQILKNLRSFKPVVVTAYPNIYSRDFPQHPFHFPKIQFQCMEVDKGGSLWKWTRGKMK